MAPKQPIPQGRGVAKPKAPVLKGIGLVSRKANHIPADSITAGKNSKLKNTSNSLIIWAFQSLKNATSHHSVCRILP